jgi:hypothetical protein
MKFQGLILALVAGMLVATCIPLVTAAGTAIGGDYIPMIQSPQAGYGNLPSAR